MAHSVTAELQSKDVYLERAWFSAQGPDFLFVTELWTSASGTPGNESDIHGGDT